MVKGDVDLVLRHTAEVFIQPVIRIQFYAPDRSSGERTIPKP
jgi:hypothetical protein